MAIKWPTWREDIGLARFKIGFFLKKNFTKFYRSHLSHGLAVLLAVLTVGRELYEHFGAKGPVRVEATVPATKWSWWLIFVVGLAIATVAAAVWELFGNRMATTQQEVRFIIGMNTLLKKYNIYERQLESAQTMESSVALLENFLSELLAASSGIICGKNRVDVSIMLENREENALVLEKDKFYRSDRAKAEFVPPERFVIPLGKNTGEDVGPAETAFKEQKYIAHMPNKRTKRGMLILQDSEEDYEPKGQFKGWFPSRHQAYEEFRSILSVPITSYRDNERNDIFGVLNFTIRNSDQWIKRDLFIDRDYIMASCFSLLAAMAVVENKNRLRSLDIQKDPRADNA